MCHVNYHHIESNFIANQRDSQTCSNLALLYRNLVEETAKEHDQTGTLLLLLRCIEAHPVIISWLLGSFFILQVSPYDQ